MKLVTGLQFPAGRHASAVGGQKVAGAAQDRRHGLPGADPAALAHARSRTSCCRWRSCSRTAGACARERDGLRRQGRGPAGAGRPRAGIGDKYPWELSGGMQQRASLCRALIHEPQLLMLDEPFGALDSFTREELWCVMRDLHAARPVTIILVTHDLREAAFLADRIFCMSARPGRIIAERAGRRSRARATSRSPTRAEFTDIVHELRSQIATREAGRMTRRAVSAAAHRRRALRLHHRLLRAVGGGLPALQDPVVLPARPQRHRPGHASSTGGQLLFHSFHTLWMTLAGFAHRRGVRHPARHRARRLAHRQCRQPAAAGRLQRHPEGRRGADPDPVVRGRLDPAGA